MRPYALYGSSNPNTTEKPHTEAITVTPSTVHLSIFFAGLYRPAAAFAAPAPESDFEYGASNGRAIIRKYKGAGGTVEIPATLGGYPVTGIKMQAFIECTSLKSVSMPESMTWIGDSAFAGCTGLEQVEISPNLTTIGPNSFYSCNGLTSVVVPDKVTIIESLAFFGCLNLESITIPASVTTLDSTFVFGCTNLKKIEFKGTQVFQRHVNMQPRFRPPDQHNSAFVRLRNILL